MLHFSDLKHLGPIWCVTLLEDGFIFAHTYRTTYFEFRQTRDLYVALRLYRGQKFFSDRGGNVAGRVSFDACACYNLIQAVTAH